MEDIAKQKEKKLPHFRNSSKINRKLVNWRV